MQLCAAASVAPQVPSDTANVLLALLVLKPLRVMACVFGLFTAMVCAALVVPTVVAAKLIVAGVTCGGTSATCAPAPARLALALPCGVVTLTVPVALPTTLGVKVIVITQLAPPARLAPQVLVCAKPAPLLTTVTAVMGSAVLFGLVKVSVCGRLG